VTMARGIVASLIKMASLDWPGPNWSTLCHRQARISVQIPWRRAGRPINLFIDIEPWEHHRLE